MPRGTRKYIVLQQIREALVQSGYTKLDQQAKALGVHRSTAWTIIKTRHKLGACRPRQRSAFSLIRILRRQCALSFKNIWPKDRLAKLLVCASCVIQGSRGHLVRFQRVEGQRGAGRVMPPPKPVPAPPTPSVLRRPI